MLSTEKERLFKKRSGEKIAKFFDGNVSAKLARLRPFVESLFDEVYKMHKKGASGYTVCHSISDIIDSIFQALHKSFAQKREKFDAFNTENFCIVALGGYGRRELCPKSDIDIMFLYSNSKVNDVFKTLAIDEIMYPLWDLGCKLGHSSRTLNEAMEEAKNDVITRTSMLDARFLCGSRALYDKFTLKFEKMCIRTADSYIDELLRLKTARHKKYGWSPYVQEPNIKNGVGGLRDFQTLLWVCRLKTGSRNLLDLVRNKLLSVAEYKMLRRSYNYLLQLRNAMHYKAKRPNELLDLELQPKIAYNLGYRKRDVVERVELFMRDVYFALREIDSASKTARKRMRIDLPGDIEKTLGIKHSKYRKLRFIDGFILKDGFIYPQNAAIFRKDPTLLIKVFRNCQKFGVQISDELELLIRDNAHLIDADVRADKSANAEFMKILRSRWPVYPVLSEMHFLNILGKFIPEFGELTCLVQHEFYHRYTADIHTLNSIRELDRIFAADVHDKNYGYYHAILSDAQNSTVLYLALLCHDLGKSDGIRGHAEVGAEIAEPILKRFGVPHEDAETIIFLVKNHLMMARYWQRNDIENEAVIAKFAEMVGDEDRLKYLYVLTFCDSKATSEELWNSYKDLLHTMLYRNTRRILTRDPEQIETLFESRRQKVLDAVLESDELGLSVDEAKKILATFPQRYFMFHSREDLVLHIKMIERFRKNMKRGKSKPLLEWNNDPNKSLSTVTIVTRDTKGLFYKLASAFTYAGLNILGSKAMSSSDGFIIDTFYITSVSGGAVLSERTRDLFSEAIEKIFIKKERIALPKHKHASTKEGEESIPHHIVMERSDDKLILEVIAPDRQGLLYSITKKIYEFGYDILFARISAAERWGTNVFHLKSTSRTPVDAELRIKDEMAKIL